MPRAGAGIVFRARHGAATVAPEPVAAPRLRFRRGTRWYGALLLVAMSGVLQASPSVDSVHRVSAEAGALQRAIDSAEPGSTLLLSAGVHPGGVVIDRPLTLSGEPGAIIDAGGLGDVIRVSAPGVTVRTLDLRNSGFNLTDANAAVYADRGSHDLIVEANAMEDVAFGVWIWHSDRPLIRDNVIRGNSGIRSQDRGDGIRVYAVNHGVFERNDIRHTRDGIYIETSNGNSITDNRFRDLRFGVHYMYAHDGRVIGNDSSRTRSGFAVMMSRNLAVLDNRSVDDRNYGILLNYVTESLIAGNHVSGVSGWTGTGTDHGVSIGGEGKALFVYHSLFNEIRDNVFANSEIGIHLTAGSEDNLLHGNAFISNTIQVKYVATREQEWSVDGRGNYWSNYLGWDLDGDGVGDEPFEPNDFIDRLLWQYPEGKLLLNSPAVLILRWVQQQFPILRSPGVRDSAPLMTPPRPIAPAAASLTGVREDGG